ncbi:hypothetical protein LCGC14_1142630 [marine sediment metagenome]|uniref:JAB domain-containing protein n=1 Tax=marine sediment metagenome TaxID=412755 RepID=A0A0F9LXY4_9ZZZZ
MTASQRLVVLLALILVLALAAKGCYTATYDSLALPQGYPTREVVDTKQFERLQLNDSLTLVVASAYYSAFPNELGLCIYGDYNSNGTITVAGLQADSMHAEAGRVEIFCEEEEDDGPAIIGNVHSHPGAQNPVYPCMPSPQDYYSLLASNLGVMVIYCANGSGVTVFRGGRQWNFAWR